MTTLQPTLLQTVTLQRRKRDVEYVTLSHVADAYRRYPGEPVTFHTRIDVLLPIAEFQLGLDIPPGIEVGDIHAPDQLRNPAPAVISTCAAGLMNAPYFTVTLPFDKP